MPRASSDQGILKIMLYVFNRLMLAFVSFGLQLANQHPLYMNNPAAVTWLEISKELVLL